MFSSHLLNSTPEGRKSYLTPWRIQEKPQGFWAGGKSSLTLWRIQGNLQVFPKKKNVQKVKIREDSIRFFSQCWQLNTDPTCVKQALYNRATCQTHGVTIKKLPPWPYCSQSLCWCPKYLLPSKAEHMRSRVLLMSHSHTVARTIVTSRPSCSQGPCWGPWSYHSWCLCWSPVLHCHQRSF